MLITNVHHEGLYVDFIITTLNGNIYLLSSNALYNPLKSWHNVRQYQSLYQESIIFFNQDNPKYVNHQTFTITFEIINNYKNTHIPYTIYFQIGNEILLKKYIIHLVFIQKHYHHYI